MAESDVTRLIHALNAGDDGASDALVSAVYDELRAMAGAAMRGERPSHTLQPTALVSEAYIRLTSGDQKWENRAHFFSAASQAMRRILIDSARKRLADKRGGGAQRVTLHDFGVEEAGADADLLALDEALDALEQTDKRLAEVVQLRYFAGLTVDQVAEMTGRSASTVKRDWLYARAWLHERIDGGDAPTEQ